MTADLPTLRRSDFSLNADQQAVRAAFADLYPVQFGGAPSEPVRAPEFNEHGDNILTQELGMDGEDVIKLKVRGVVA